MNSWPSSLAAASLARLNNGADPAAFREHARFHLRHLARLTTRPEHIKQLRQTILNLAVRGRLVPQDPDDEPASVGNDTRPNNSAAPVDLMPDMSSAPPESGSLALPRGWAWARIGDLLEEDSQNGFSKKPDDAVDGVPILRISAGTIRSDGIVAEEEHKLIGGVSTEVREKYRVRNGDLLACRFNGNREFVGRLSLYTGYLGIDQLYPDKLIRLRLAPTRALPALVRWFAGSDLVRADIANYSATTVGNWGISASNLKKVRLPIPPLAEQHRIIAKVNQLTAACDALEARLATRAGANSHLLETLLYNAICGAP